MMFQNLLLLHLPLCSFFQEWVILSHQSFSLPSNRASENLDPSQSSPDHHPKSRGDREPGDPIPGKNQLFVIERKSHQNSFFQAVNVRVTKGEYLCRVLYTVVDSSLLLFWPPTRECWPDWNFNYCVNGGLIRTGRACSSCLWNTINTQSCAAETCW